jgi:predicted molibdopterin-dependent oxidoreductase YjgC
MNRVIAPLPETRSDLAIFSMLANRLGLEDYNPKSDQEYLKEMVANTPGLSEMPVPGISLIPRESMTAAA